MSKQSKRSIFEAIPYLVILGLLFSVAAYTYAAGYDFATTVNSRMAYGQKIGTTTVYQYRIAAASATWFSDIIPLNGAKRASMIIFKATGNLDADWSGTVGTGDFYLKGKVGGTVEFPTNTVSDLIPGATSAMVTLPYIWGPKAPLSHGDFARGATSIDVYGTTFYDLENFGPLTHIQANVTTNNVLNTIIIAVE